eukprot:6169754-Alexandrium_andersonii.AAC.1
MVEGRAASHRNVEVPHDAPRLREGSRADLHSVDPALGDDPLQHGLCLASDHLQVFLHRRIVLQDSDHVVQGTMRLKPSTRRRVGLW